MTHSTVIAPPQKTLEIVPRKSLPVVAIALIGLIVAIATNRLWAIDFYHVVGGGMWTAIDLLLGFVLGPILGTMSIPSRIELTKRLMPKMVVHPCRPWSSWMDRRLDDHRGRTCNRCDRNSRAS